MERDIQKITENNVATIFGFEFVCSEYQLQNLRIDTLAFDKENKSFVVIEYKRDRNQSVIEQGFSYLALMLNNKADFILDTHDKFDYYSKNQNRLRGVLIQFLPAKYDIKNYQSGIIPDDIIFNYADFIYPPSLEMTLSEIEQWIETEKNKLEQNKEFVFHKVYYWYCGEFLTTLIEREKNWIDNNFKTIDRIWKYVLFLREHQEIALEFKNYIEGLKIKYNDSILKKLDNLINEYNKSIMDDK